MKKTRNNVAISTVILILVLGLLLKWNSVVEALDEHKSVNRAIDLLPVEFDTPTRMEITTNDSRHVTRVRHRQCDGSLFLLQIKRNSEDAALFLRWQLEPIFVFENRIYSEFPTVEFWIRRSLSKFSATDDPAPVVTAIAEIGNCAMKHLLFTSMQIATIDAK